MSQSWALARSGLLRTETAALQALERARREGAPVPPEIRRAWRTYKQSGRMPVLPPRLTKLPRVLRLADPASPTGVRTIRPTPGQGAVFETEGGTVVLTPQKILSGYLEQRGKLPAYQAALADSQRRLSGMGPRIRALRSAFTRRRPAVELRQALREIDREHREQSVAVQELQEGVEQAAGKLQEQESRASSEDGMGLLFLAWPLAVVVASLALGGYGVFQQHQQTKRLEQQLDAVEKGVLPPSQVDTGFSLFKIGGAGLEGLLPLAGVATVGWLLLRRRRRRRG